MSGTIRRAIDVGDMVRVPHLAPTLTGIEALDAAAAWRHGRVRSVHRYADGSPSGYLVDCIESGREELWHAVGSGPRLAELTAEELADLGVAAHERGR